MTEFAEYAEKKYLENKPELISRLTPIVGQEFGPKDLSTEDKRLFNDFLYWSTIYRILLTLDYKDNIPRKVMIAAGHIVPEMQAYIRIDLRARILEWQLEYLEKYPGVHPDFSMEEIEKMGINLELAIVFQLREEASEVIDNLS